MGETRFRVTRQTPEQAAELRRLLDAKRLSGWDQGRLRALAQHAPQREHQEALEKLGRMADSRKAKRARQASGDGPSLLGD